ncbi:hypothetical protein [Leptothermofonsia sp. ETS-13]|uniref:hypothetical protein n=1 Tax=Leptothermofonsia sp. ETS-13 TaxID=3035696 RepID=UPI003BA30693
MNRAPGQLRTAISDGWVIHIYGGDRRLLCSLYPSHGWAFLTGIGLGFILALLSLDSQIIAQSSPSVSTPVSAPLNLE